MWLGLVSVIEGLSSMHVGVWDKILLEITKVDWNHLLKGGCMVRVQKIYFAKKNIYLVK